MDSAAKEGYGTSPLRWTCRRWFAAPMSALRVDLSMYEHFFFFFRFFVRFFFCFLLWGFLGRGSGPPPPASFLFLGSVLSSISSFFFLASASASAAATMGGGGGGVLPIGPRWAYETLDNHRSYSPNSPCLPPEAYQTERINVVYRVETIGIEAGSPIESIRVRNDESTRLWVVISVATVVKPTFLIKPLPRELNREVNFIGPVSVMIAPRVAVASPHSLAILIQKYLGRAQVVGVYEVGRTASSLHKVSKLSNSCIQVPKRESFSS